ncbi:hypothetical protein CE91St43_10140 [Oscillospiraceae bacterium]|nr:hypothetical protein CE91St43_10140 [Oscillospiraceae bacterium]
MNKWKKFLTAALTAGMILGLMPTTAWAAAAQVIVEPTYVYGQVYNFDANNKALVNDAEWKPMTVTASDAGLTAAPASSLSAYQDEATGKYGYRDENDKIVISAAYDDIFTWSADDSVKLLIVDKDGKDGAIDRKGKTVIPFQYSYLCPAYGTDGKYYEAMTEEGWGVLDASGKTVIPMVYDYITNYDELPGGVPVFWASQGESDVLVSAVNGQPVFTVPAEVYVRGDFNGGNLVDVWNSTIQKGGYLDVTGNLAVPCIFDEVRSFVGDLTYVGMNVEDSYDSKFAVMNSQGVLLTDYIYDYPYELSGGDGLISVRDPETKLFGYMNAAGMVVIPCQYDTVSNFTNGLAVVSTYDAETYNNSFGIIDTTGGIVLPIQYADIGGSWESYDGVSDYVWIAQRVGYEKYYGLAKIDRTAASTPAPVENPTAPTAVPTSYPVILDGQQVAFDVYAMKDANGNDTNYFKLRDVAFKLNGTPAQFNVGWDGSVTITTGAAYEANGSEMSAPFSGPQSVSDVKTTTLVNGIETALETITLTDAGGSGYTYYKLRDLGAACGFVVDWDAAAGAIVINTKV